MSKTAPTPEAPKPKARLNLVMKDFSFFAKDKDLVIDEMFTILDSGHYLTLFMTQSSSLSNDLYTISHLFRYDYKIDFDFTKDEYDKGQVIVYLEKEVQA